MLLPGFLESLKKKIIRVAQPMNSVVLILPPVVALIYYIEHPGRNIMRLCIIFEGDNDLLGPLRL